MHSSSKANRLVVLGPGVLLVDYAVNSARVRLQELVVLFFFPLGRSSTRTPKRFVFSRCKRLLNSSSDITSLYTPDTGHSTDFICFNARLNALQPRIR